MVVTIWRWGVGVAMGCAAMAAILLPFPPTVPETWTSAAPAPLASELASLAQVAGQAHAAARSYRAARALDRWSAARSNADTALVRLDRSVPPDVADKARRIVLKLWTGLAKPVSAQHAEVFVYVDSTPIPRADSAATTRRWLEPRQLVDVAYALPGATNGRECVALVRLRGVSDAHLEALRGQSLIGICGLYAAFGLPGIGVQAWLARSNFRFARRSDWSLARAQTIDASALYGLGGPAARCLTGSPDACRSALRLELPGASREPQPDHRLAWVLDAALSANATAPALLGGAEDELLADAVRSLGPERFARFWQSPSAPDTAFFTATGTGIEEWTQRWLTQVYGAPPARPSVGVGELLWWSIAATVALLVARRPRERVLA